MSKTVAKYQQYAEYKDSGVEWLGEIPSHWQTKKLKFILLDLVRGPFGSALKKEFFLDSGFKVYEQKNCIRNDVTIGNSYISKKMFQELDRFSIRENDLLMSCSGTIGKVVRVPESFEQGIINQALLIMRLNKNIVDLNYFLHVFRSSDIQNQIKDNTQGGAMQNLVATDIFKSISITVPKIEEQTQIANFLDHETAKIDNLIEKQQQLIQLLKEKRQAVISNAVTKGLNPNVPMKDSGVEWLGEVPEHWTVSKFGYISQVVRGGSPRPAGDPTLFNGDYSPWVTVAEITKDDELYLTSTETFLTKKGSEQCRVFQAGTLLLSNSGATLGVPKILCINANANDGVVGFEDLRIDTVYAYFYLSVLTNDLRERVKQGSGQPNLNTDIVKAISITIPPVNEIKEIVADIKKKIDHFAKLMKSAESAIQLMQERRTALISAAVTGKIDVRNWQNPNNNNEAKTEFSA